MNKLLSLTLLFTLLISSCIAIDCSTPTAQRRLQRYLKILRRLNRRHDETSAHYQYRINKVQNRYRPYLACTDAPTAAPTTAEPTTAQPTASPTNPNSICIWESTTNGFTYHNGEYHKQPAPDATGHDYFVMDAPTGCPSENYYYQAVSFPPPWDHDDQVHYSVTSDHQNDVYIDNYPVCQSWTDISNLYCDVGRDAFLYYPCVGNDATCPGHGYAHDMKVSEGGCPSWDCELLEVDIPAVYTGCSGAFYERGDNVYGNVDDSVYWWFNEKTFRLYCSSAADFASGQDSCDDAGIGYIYRADDHIGWFDLVRNTHDSHVEYFHPEHVWFYCH